MLPLLRNYSSSLLLTERFFSHTDAQVWCTLASTLEKHMYSAKPPRHARVVTPARDAAWNMGNQSKCEAQMDHSCKSPLQALKKHGRMLKVT